MYMSIIGWLVNPDALVKKFSVETSEEFVMRIKYDPDTGKQLKDKQKVVIKEAKSEIKFNGETLKLNGETLIVSSDKWVLSERLTHLICSELTIDYEIQGGGVICFGLFLEDGEKFGNIVKMSAKLEAVRKKLIKHGIPFSNKSSPIFISYSY